VSAVADLVVTERAAEAIASFPDHELGRLEAELVQRFCPPLQPEDVRSTLRSCADRYQAARVRTYLSILVERAALQDLRGLVATAGEGRPADVVPIASARGPAPEVELDLTSGSGRDGGEGHGPGPDGVDPSGSEPVVGLVLRRVPQEATT
jgi:hypothetical protein